MTYYINKHRTDNLIEAIDAATVYIENLMGELVHHHKFNADGGPLVTMEHLLDELADIEQAARDVAGESMPDKDTGSE